MRDILFSHLSFDRIELYTIYLENNFTTKKTQCLREKNNRIFNGLNWFEKLSKLNSHQTYQHTNTLGTDFSGKSRKFSQANKRIVKEKKQWITSFRCRRRLK